MVTLVVLGQRPHKNTWEGCKVSILRIYNSLIPAAICVSHSFQKVTFKN